jgi:hypothetical protein
MMNTPLPIRSTPALFAAALLCSHALHAQASPPLQAVSTVLPMPGLNTLAGTLPASMAGQLAALNTGLSGLSAREMGASRVVTGAPYCAEAVHESVQTLADGNRIVRKNSTKWCRDGQGRTRQETQRAGRPVVYLRDPVANQSWILDVQNKTAAPLGATRMAMHSTEWQQYGERMREWARGFAQRMRAQVPPAKSSAEQNTAEPVVIASAPASSNAAGQDVYVIRMPGEDAPATPAKPVPATPLPPEPPTWPAMPAPASAASWMSPGMPLWGSRGQGVQTSLGSKEFDGLKAHGERTTWTIQAGQYGNEKPIVITSEKWTVPELMLTVYARDVDPRSGETIYKLTNLKHGEPDVALFKVPSDFKVREAGSINRRTHEPEDKIR